MKHALTLLALLATIGHLTAYTLPSVGRGELATEFQDFVDLLPVKEVMDLTTRYIARDMEFRMVMDLLQSSDIKDFLRDVQAMPEFSRFVDYVHGAGLDVNSLIESLREAMEMEPVTVNHASSCKITGGFAGYAQDLADILPLDEITALFDYKAATSDVFAGFLNECHSPEYANLFTAEFSNANFANAMQELDNRGIDRDIFQSNFSYLLVIRAVLREYV